MQRLQIESRLQLQFLLTWGCSRPWNVYLNYLLPAVLASANWARRPCTGVLGPHLDQGTSLTFLQLRFGSEIQSDERHLFLNVRMMPDQQSNIFVSCLAAKNLSMEQGCYVLHHHMICCLLPIYTSKQLQDLFLWESVSLVLIMDLKRAFQGTWRQSRLPAILIVTCFFACMSILCY